MKQTRKYCPSKYYNQKKKAKHQKKTRYQKLINRKKAQNSTLRDQKSSPLEAYYYTRKCPWKSTDQKFVTTDIELEH